MTDIKEMNEEQIDQLNQQTPKRRRRKSKSSAPAFTAIEEASPEEITAALQKQTSRKSELTRKLEELAINGGYKIDGDFDRLKRDVLALGRQLKRKFVVSEANEPGKVIVVRVQEDGNASGAAQ